MSTPAPIPPATLLDDLHPKRFLQVSDLLDRWHVQSLVVLISRMIYEETIPNPRDLDPATADQRNPKGKPRVVVQPVLYFQAKTGAEFPRGYLLSAGVDVESLKAATGARTVGDLVGKRITITVGEYKHQAVLRISPQPAQPAQPAAEKPAT
jgi:hypothetical protein